MAAFHLAAALRACLGLLDFVLEPLGDGSSCQQVGVTYISNNGRNISILNEVRVHTNAMYTFTSTSIQLSASFFKINRKSLTLH